MKRPSNRAENQLREIKFEINVAEYAEGSCLVSFGKTKVLCTASVDEFVPPFLRGTGKGWITAEYGMLPRSTHSRMPREAAKGKQGGRTVEIQRLIGRSLRACVDLEALGEKQIIVDCDVINADGGTRTASISGGFVALYLAIEGLKKNYGLKNSTKKVSSKNPVVDFVAAVSCGIYNGVAVLDLDYAEDSNAGADGNFVLTEKGNIIEVQATAEEYAISENDFNQMLSLAKEGITEIIKLQKQALGIS